MQGLLRWFLTCAVLCYAAHGQLVPYSPALEKDLRKWLFSNFDTLSRPEKRVRVHISFNLISINSLDIKDQTLSTTGIVQMEWGNLLLAWVMNSTYDDIIYTFTNQNLMWRPSIVLQNSVSELKVLSDIETPIRLSKSGWAWWSPGGIFYTSCEADVTYYPLDTQECSLVLTSWVYTSTEIALDFADIPIVLSDYGENGEWELTGTETKKITTGVLQDRNTYDRLIFTVKLKRRPLYHVLNTIFPVLLMSCLIIFVFKLPPESGERVGMSLTVLLAYAVYLSLVLESFPQTSLNASILATYLTTIYMLSSLSVIFTIIVLDLYFNHDDDEAPSGWLRKFAAFLAKVIRWKGAKWCSKEHDSLSETKNGIATTQVEKISIPIGNGLNVQKRGIPKTKVSSVSPAPDDDASDDGNQLPYSWKEVALILDRFFMYLFIFLIVSTTVICLSLLITKII